MPANRKPRRRYRPGHINPRAWEAAMLGTCRPHIDDRVYWQAEMHDAVLAVSRGQATLAQWRNLFDACNLVEEIVRMGLAQDPDGLVADAQGAVAAILDRQRDTGQRAVRAAELAAPQPPAGVRVITAPQEVTS